MKLNVAIEQMIIRNYAICSINIVLPPCIYEKKHSTQTYNWCITVFLCQMSHLSRVARDDASHHNTYYAAIGQQVVYSLMKQVMSKFT